MPQFGLILQLVLAAGKLDDKFKVGQRHLHVLLPAFHAIDLDQLAENQVQLFLADIARLVQAFHVVEIAFMEIGGGNALYAVVARGTPYLLDVIDKGA